MRENEDNLITFEVFVFVKTCCLCVFSCKLKVVVSVKDKYQKRQFMSSSSPINKTKVQVLQKETRSMIGCSQLLRSIEVKPHLSRWSAGQLVSWSAREVTVVNRSWSFTLLLAAALRHIVTLQSSFNEQQQRTDWLLYALLWNALLRHSCLDALLRDTLLFYTLFWRV